MAGKQDRVYGYYIIPFFQVACQLFLTCRTALSTGNFQALVYLSSYLSLPIRNPGMKYLMALNVAQLACLVLLLVMMGGMTNADPDSNDESSRPVTGALQGHSVSNNDQNMVRGSSSGILDEAQLRRIIREELNAHGVPVANRASSEPENSGTRQRNQAEDEYRAVFVEQQIEYYRSIGEISPLQMQDLQTEIATLDHAARKQALSNLMRAMNSGEIKGQL